MNNNEFKGTWISPNGDVYETDNIQSHRLVIKELNMENTLMNFSKTYKWSKEELKLNYNNDIIGGQKIKIPLISRKHYH